MPAIPSVSTSAFTGPRRLFARAISAVLLSAVPALAASGCDSGSSQGELPPCRCEVESCSSATCPIEVSFDSTCVGEVTLAEVMVDGHVEAQAVRPSERLTTCSRIEPGKTATIYVRGGPWIWGPLQETCTTPSETRALVLQCVEAR